MNKPEPGSQQPSPPRDEAPPVAAPEVQGAAAAKPLTPEEQMAAFEKDLKENDWGHQPC